MQKVKVVVSGWVLGLGLLLAAPALADIPPPDACTEADEGKACDNAGENADEPGVCKKDSCTRQTPSGSMTYECYVCQETTGTGGAANHGGSSDDTSAKDDDGGCSMSPAPARGLAALFAPVAALGLAAARRRRSRR